MGIARAYFTWGNFFDIDTKGTRHSGRTENFLFAFIAEGNCDRPDAFKTCGDTCFSLK